VTSDKLRAAIALWVSCLLALLIGAFGDIASAQPQPPAADAGVPAPLESDAEAPDAADAALQAAVRAPEPSARKAVPAATAAPRSTAAGTLVHGLAPLPGGASVPLHDRPPGATRDERGPSSVIFPVQKLTIRFNHEKHVKGLKISCVTCHDKAKTSRSSADSLVPRATRCDACHGSDHRARGVVRAGSDLIGQCGFCHIGYRESDGQRVEAFSIPPPNLKFNHAIHLERNIKCQQCHGNVENIELATADQLPRMRGCFGCHQMPVPARGEARGECATCHLTERGGLMKTEFATGSLTPPRWLYNAGHGPDWIERHKVVAGADSRFCGSCHSESYCMDCHDGRVRPRKVHPNDWISMHPVASRQNNPSCTSCHRQQSFCLGCHQRAGVTMTGPYANFAGRGNFHPPKAIWTDPPRTSAHHAWEAQRNINACVSCHVERDCAICHATAKVGGRGIGGGGIVGQGVNPHPTGFSSRCSGALKRNARPCLVCHDPADPKLLACR
jgi:hypothetical protein